ncbi:MAG: TonB-dependent receptor [Novosphingobium sp.]|nr:TonB-dependent receptor [Novosphingobium sp.]
MVSNKAGFKLLGCVATSALMCSVNANAQSAGDVSGRAQSSVADTSADEGVIVVNAQKRAQNVQDVGITINAFSAATLENAGIKDATQLTQLTPALNLSGSYGGQVLSFAIRGVTQQDFSAQAEGPVAVYLDDGYMALNNSAGVGLFDLDHVEVLKGPQGTLFGRNATGGLVNIVTRKPSDVADGYATISYGSYNEARAEAAVGGPIADGIAFRLAGAVSTNGAYIKNLSPTGGDLGGGHGYALRGHLNFKMSPDATLLLSGYASKSYSSWAPYYVFASTSVADANGIEQNTVEVPGPTGAGSPVTAGGSRQVISNYAQDSGGSNSLKGGTAKLTLNIGPELTLLTDYKDAETRFLIDAEGASSFFNGDTRSRVRNFSQEARLFGRNDGWRWYAGAYYLHINAQVDPNRSPFPAFGSIVDDYNKLITDSYSAFGQIEIDLAPQVTLVAGARVTREIKDFDYRAEVFSSDLTAVPIADLGPARTPYSGHRADWLYNGKAQLEYRPAQGLLFYAGWSRGSKAGNFTSPYAGSTTFPDSALSYKPETLNAYEVGTKADLLGRVIQLDASGFYYDYKNYQSFQFVGLSSLVVNRPAQTYGGELMLNVRPAEGLTMSGGASFTHNNIKDVPVGGVVKDRIAPFTSKWQALASVAYTWNALGGKVTANANGHYTGPFYFSVSNFSTTHVAGYTTLDLRLSWADVGDMWKLSVFGTNVTQEKYRTVGFDLTGLCGCTQVGYGRPRWLGASVTRNF